MSVLVVASIQSTNLLLFSRTAASRRLLLKRLLPGVPPHCRRPPQVVPPGRRGTPEAPRAVVGLGSRGKKIVIIDL